MSIKLGVNWTRVKLLHHFGGFLDYDVLENVLFEIVKKNIFLVFVYLGNKL